jgi:uncharacterized protein (TIGR02453 family)
MSGSASFSRDLIRFLTELRSHNNRAWFERHRARYERVYRVAFASFIEDFAPRLRKISPHFVADPRSSGGSVMRIYRDTRFSRDKSPYRSYTVVHFRHKDGEEGRAPGFFLYVAPDEISGGGGIWHPESLVARKIRSAIVRGPERWVAAISGRAFRERFKMTGESFQRPPSGVRRDHPQVAELMRKDFVASTSVPISRFVSPKFPAYYEEICREVSPMMEFLSNAVGLPW